MYKLGLEKAEEPEIKLPTFNGLQRKKGNDVQNSLLDSVGEGESGMIWENGIET